MTVETTTDQPLDLLSLSGLRALEALHSMSENGTALRLGSYALLKLITVGQDQLRGDVVVSAVLVSEQLIRFSFSPDSEPTINPQVQVIGSELVITKEPIEGDIVDEPTIEDHCRHMAESNLED